MLQAIGDEYLAVKPRRIFDPFERENDTLFKIPSLEIVKPFNSIGDSAFGHALHGKVKDGWILNGVLWDSGFKKRKLLLFPSNLLATPDRLDAEDGVVSILTEGPHIGGWSPDQTNRSIGFKMLENSVTLVASDKALYILPQNSPRNNRTLGYKKIPYVLSPPWDDDECIEREWSHPGKTIISENEGNVFTAANGVIYTIPKELVVAKQENFHFEEQQTSFILEAGKVNRVSYTAEGASNYHLKMWYGIPRDMIGENGISRLDAAAVINLESTSGDFDLNLDPQAVVQVALSQLKNLNPNYSPQTVKENQRIVVEHIKAISDDVQAITGKAPRSIPIVAIAQIVAEHHDGTEKAGLLHCFLVEPPIKEIQKTLQGLLKVK